MNDAIANLEKYTGVDQGIKEDLNELRWNFLNVNDAEYNQRDFFANSQDDRPVGRIINYFPGEGEVTVSPGRMKSKESGNLAPKEDAKSLKADELNREKADDEKMRNYLSSKEPVKTPTSGDLVVAPATLQSTAGDLGLYEKKPDVTAPKGEEASLASSLNPGNMESAILSDTERKKVHADVDTDLRNIFDVMNSLKRATFKKNDEKRKKTEAERLRNGGGDAIDQVMVNYRDDDTAALHARQEAQHVSNQNKIKSPEDTELGPVGRLLKNLKKDDKDVRGSKLKEDVGSRKVSEEEHEKAGKRHDPGELGNGDDPLTEGGGGVADISKNIHKIINMIKQKNDDPDTLLNVGRDDVAASSEPRDVGDLRAGLAREVNDIRDIDDTRDVSDTSLVRGDTRGYDSNPGGGYNPSDKSEVFDSSLIVSQPDENVMNERGGGGQGYPAVEETGTSRRDIIVTSSDVEKKKDDRKKLL